MTMRDKGNRNTLQRQSLSNGEQWAGKLSEGRTTHEIPLYPEPEVLAAFPLQNFRVATNQ